jgi:hypothetical protein
MLSASSALAASSALGDVLLPSVVYCVLWTIELVLCHPHLYCLDILLCAAACTALRYRDRLSARTAEPQYNTGVRMDALGP